MNSSNTEPQKVHLKQKLHCVWRGNRSLLDYVTEIKQIQGDLASINVEVPDDDLVSVTLNGLGPEYKSLDTSICVRGHMPDFEELVNLCLQEEHVHKFGEFDPSIINRFVANYNSLDSDAGQQATILQPNSRVHKRFTQAAYVRPQDAASNSLEGDHIEHISNEAMFESEIDKMIEMIMDSKRLIYDDMKCEADMSLYGLFRLKVLLVLLNMLAKFGWSDTRVTALFRGEKEMPIVRPGQIDQHGVQQQPQHNQQAQANVIYVETQEQQELEPVMVHQTEQKKEHEEGWYYDCYQCGQVEEIEALAITRAKSKGPNNWKEQKDVRDKVHAKVRKCPAH
ncbi:hypothetical protein L7F22_060290 [Adiantum nelumboides]|nr:hypothetical protein [Adiantum nelumboides]